MSQQKVAVQSGHWPLYRYKPGEGELAQPFQLDSAEPTVPFADFAASEARFSMLGRSNPARATELIALAQADVDSRYSYYRQLAGLERSAPAHAAVVVLAETEEDE
jgi:pyruvate-ferredoxin/flavodoxin oxidoreductase